MPSDTTITTVLLLLAAGWLYWRKPGPPAAKPASPADRLRAMYASSIDIPVEVATSAPRSPSEADAVAALVTLRERLTATGLPTDKSNSLLDPLAPLIMRGTNGQP